jgi:hypothetical protein
MVFRHQQTAGRAGVVNSKSGQKAAEPVIAAGLAHDHAIAIRNHLVPLIVEALRREGVTPEPVLIFIVGKFTISYRKLASGFRLEISHRRRLMQIEWCGSTITVAACRGGSGSMRL